MSFDTKDFEKITYRKPEWSSIAEDVWIWNSWTLMPEGPGHYSFNLFTIPVGRRAIISDIADGFQYDGEIVWRIAGGDNVFWQFLSRHETKSHSFTLPPVALAGQTVWCEYFNQDIIAGHRRSVLTMWLVAGSEPENPTKDTPAEHFRVGNFRSVNHIDVGGGESIYLFHKNGDTKESYVRFKDYGKGKGRERVLSNGYLSKSEVENVFSRTDDVEKLKRELNKL